MKLQTFIGQLKQKDTKKLAAGILSREKKHILGLLKAHSPVDMSEHRDGVVFKDNWKITSQRFTSSNTLASLSVKNNTRYYGQFIAAGADPGKAPWYYPNRDKKGRFVKGTGKLKKSGGKIWAGGHHPGHAKTVGGPIVNVFSKYVDKFYQKFSDEFVKGFI